MPPHTAGKSISAENNFSINAIKDFNSFFGQKIELPKSDAIEDLVFHKSIEEEMKALGLAALILKIYNIKEDDLSLKNSLRVDKFLNLSKI